MRFALCVLLLGAPLISSAQVLEPGDVLLVRVPPDKKKKMTIGLDGSIELRTYGKFQVSGKTPARAQAWLRRQLSRLIRNIGGVSLRLHKAGRLVLLTGNVKNPGTVTVGKEDDVWQAISKAGGPAAGADLSRVTLIRDKKEMYVNVAAYLAGNRRVKIPIVLRGDTIFVPTGGSANGVGNPGAVFLNKEAVKNKIFVLGSVVRPGMYNRPVELDAVGALALAGGPKDGADLENLRVITQTGTLRLNAAAWLDGRTTKRPRIPSVGGVIVYVPARGKGGGGVLGNKVAIVGGVKNASRIGVPPGTKLVDLVGMGGGPETNADASEIKLVRRGERFTIATEYDMDDYLDYGGLMALVEVQGGDIVHVGRKSSWEYFKETIGVVSSLASVATSFALFVGLSNSAKAGGE